MNIDHYIEKFGEEYRNLIINALEWLEKEEPSWNLEVPIDKGKYIEDIIRRVVKLKEVFEE